MRKRRLTTRQGIALVLVMALSGLVVGWIVDRAVAVPPSGNGTPVQVPEGPGPTSEPQLAPEAGPSGGSLYAKVRPGQGPAKYQAGNLDRQPRAVKYGKRQRKVIVNALVKAHQRRNARAAVSSDAARPAVPSRKAIWRNFRKSDRCSMLVHTPGSGTGPNPDYDWFACKSQIPRASKLTDNEIRGYICGGWSAVLAPLAIGSGPWGWIGVGAAWSQCYWNTFGY